MQQRYRECDRKRMSVLVDRRHLEDVVPVLGLPGMHGFVVALPMPFLMPLWCDQIKRLAYCFFLRIAKKTSSSRVPENNCTARISGDDSVTYGVDELPEVDF